MLLIPNPLPWLWTAFYLYSTYKGVEGITSLCVEKVFEMASKGYRILLTDLDKTPPNIIH